jgi:outer membrane protein
MRIQGIVRGVAVMLLGLMLASTAARAASPAPLSAPVVVVVDMVQIMRDAKAAKEIQAQVDHEMNAYKQEVQKREDELRAMRSELERQRTVLAPEVFNRRSQQYQQQYAALDSDVQAKQRAMQQSYGEAMTKVEKVALQIIADVAKERKANMVVAKAALLYMEDGLDVTAEVTQRLDQKIPTMAVDLPRLEGDVAVAPKGRAPAKR